MNVNVEFDTTEFRTYPDEKNQSTVFNIDKKSMIITFCDEHDNILTQSEISIEDARHLSKIIIAL